MKISRFLIKIIGGRVAFKSEAHKRMFSNWLAQWEGKEVGLEIAEKKEKRTDQQNRYYWMYLEVIAREHGDDPEELHAFFRGKFLTKKITEIYGEKTRITKSTTELSKGEFCEYLANISVLTSVELPDTTAYYGYSYHK